MIGVMRWFTSTAVVAMLTQSHAAKPTVAHNPRRLDAVELLERNRPAFVPHVRFEWDQVPGAREYLLTGRWAAATSWAMQTRQFHVTPRSATAWAADRVLFDAALPEGSYSWSVVAVLETSVADGAPASLSFDLR